jgi:hypothetical protein
MHKEIDSYKVHLDKEEYEVAHREALSDIEKETYLANLKLMRDYKIQREKNKIFYFHYIETIVETILKHKIKEIDTPFNEKFWHILQSIEGKLSSHKIGSRLKMIEENNIIPNINIQHNKVRKFYKNSLNNKVFNKKHIIIYKFTWIIVYFVN